MDYRLIIITDIATGTKEVVNFLPEIDAIEDPDTAADLCPPGYCVACNEKITVDGGLPLGFPLNHSLVRE